MDAKMEKEIEGRVGCERLQVHANTYKKHCKYLLVELYRLRMDLKEAKEDQRELSDIHVLLERSNRHGTSKRGVLFRCDDRVRILISELDDCRKALDDVSLEFPEIESKKHRMEGG